MKHQATIAGIVAVAALLGASAISAAAETVSGRLLWIDENAEQLTPATPFPFALMWPEDVKPLKAQAIDFASVGPKRPPTFGYYSATMPLRDGSTVFVTGHFGRCFQVPIESTPTRESQTCQLRAALIRDGKIIAKADTATIKSTADFTSNSEDITELATIPVYFGRKPIEQKETVVHFYEDDNTQTHDFTTLSYDTIKKTISITLTKDGKKQPAFDIMTLK